LLHLCGDDPHGQEDTAALAARVIGRHLFVLRAEDIPAIGPDLDQLVLLWEREALLLPGALLVQCDSGALSHSTRRLAEILRGTVFLASRESVRLNRWLFRLDVDKPQPAEQKRLWQKALGPSSVHWNGALDAVSQQFMLSARTIFSTGSLFNL